MSLLASLSMFVDASPARGSVSAQLTWNTEEVLDSDLDGGGLTGTRMRAQRQQTCQ